MNKLMMKNLIETLNHSHSNKKEQLTEQSIHSLTIPNVTICSFEANLTVKSYYDLIWSEKYRSFVIQLKINQIKIYCVCPNGWLNLSGALAAFDNRYILCDNGKQIN